MSKKDRASQKEYNANAKANGWNGQHRNHPSGKACMSRKFKVDSIGFWNKGLPESKQITKASLIAFEQLLKTKGQDAFIDALHGEK